MIKPLICSAVTVTALVTGDCRRLLQTSHTTREGCEWDKGELEAVSVNPGVRLGRRTLR